MDAEVALAAGGPIDRLAKGITKATPAEDFEMLDALTPLELATELAAWLARVLPPHESIMELAGTATSELISLRRFLAATHSGNVNALGPDNVAIFVQHHELYSLVIGANVSAAVAMGMVAEIVRLVHCTVSQVLSVEQAAAALQPLDWLLPTLLWTGGSVICRRQQGLERSLLRKGIRASCWWQPEACRSVEKSYGCLRS